MVHTHVTCRQWRSLSPTAEAHLLDPWGDTVFLLHKRTTSDGGEARLGSAQVREVPETGDREIVFPIEEVVKWVKVVVATDRAILRGGTHRLCRLFLPWHCLARCSVIAQS
jgi:hypothetical protein